MRIFRFLSFFGAILLLSSALCGRSQDCNHACDPSARDASGCCPAAAPSRAKPKPRTPRPPAQDRAQSFLLLTPDADCDISVDGAALGAVRKDEVRKIPAIAGDHVIQASRSGGGEFKTIVSITAAGEQKAVAISFEAAAAGGENGATLLLLTDADCEVSVDDVSVGLVSPDSVKKVPVKMEDHLIVAKSPDGRIMRSFVKVDHAGQVAVNIACALAPPPTIDPAAAAALEEKALDSYVITAEDRYSISMTVNPVMPVTGIDRGFYNASLFQAMYVGVMKDQLTSSLVKQGFSVTETTLECHRTGGLLSKKTECVSRSAADQTVPPDCTLNLAFDIDEEKTTLRVDSTLDCAGYPAEHFKHSKDIDGRVPMWLGPSKNKAFAETFLFPTAEDIAKKIGETRAVKLMVQRKKRNAAASS